MIAWGLSIGIYSYLILALGLIGGLNKANIIILTVIYLAILFKYKKKFITKFINFYSKDFCKSLKKDKLSLVLILVLIIQALINLVGALGPELSFDALWYHLTIPKLYLINHKISAIPGGLLYYSNLPKLTEMLYAVALAIGGTTLAKFIHFSFGIGCIFALYNLLKRFGRRLALLGALIFYSQLTVGWLSTTAYVDLSRTFFEILVLNLAVNWWKNEKTSYLIDLGIMLGLAICVKLLAVFSLISISLLIILFKTKNKIKNIFLLISFSFIPVLPWILLSFINTGNPIYPIFTDWFFRSQSNGLMISEWLASRDISSFIKVIIETVFTRGDILSPIFLIGLPIIIFNLNNKKEVIFASGYFLINFWFFFMTPLNYNRFLLAYIPSFIFILIASIYKNKAWQKIIIYSAIFIAVINIIARGVSNKKFIPVILGWQSEAEFMKDNLNFKAGNFYDIDGWFSKNIKIDDKVLVMGVHNLYYINFPFDHLSFRKGESHYTYILTQNSVLPKAFAKMPLVYENKISGVKVYKTTYDY